MSPKQFPSGMWFGYVKYEEAEVDRLVAILKTNNSGGRRRPVWNTVSSPPRQRLPNYSNVLAIWHGFPDITNI